LGGEYQAEWLDFHQHDNVLGQPGPLNTRSKTLSTQAHGFAELGTKGLHNNLTAQMSLSKVAYNQSVAWSSVEAIPIGKTKLPPTLAGTLVWGHRNNSTYRRSFFLRAASAYSPPALWEMTDTLGQLRTDLKPETGINFEWRGTSEFFGRKVHTELSIYHHSVFNTIVPLNLSSGRTVYENQGGTTQIGLEGMMAMQKNLEQNDPIRSYACILSGAYQYYYFNDYELNGVSFNGKALPGIPRFTLNLQGDLGFGFGTDLQLTGQMVGKSFLNNANTVFQPTYALLHFKAMHTIRLRNKVKEPIRATYIHFAPFAGINNLLNTHYTNFPQLNATAGRYWNPAPGINWYAGVDFRF
jgi:iron complex outermembrane recepter protein